MLKLELFTRRNFAVGNAETLAVYAGLGILFFYLVIFLQQVAGYTALESGLTTLPVTLTMMFALSRRFGALADRYGPRLFMGAGPLIAAAGILLLLRVGMQPSYRRRASSGAAPVLARPLVDRRPARGQRCSRRRRRERRRHRVRDQQRHRPSRWARRRLAGRRCRRRNAPRRHLRRKRRIRPRLPPGRPRLRGSSWRRRHCRPSSASPTRDERSEAERCSGGQLYGVPEPAVEHVRASTAATGHPLAQEA